MTNEELKQLADTLSDQMANDFLDDTLERLREFATEYSVPVDLDDVVEMEGIALQMFVNKIKDRIDCFY
jgi:anti-anti-sigma regulatory factor